MSSPATILIVEDDVGVQATLREALQLEGYQVMMATTIPEAEDVVRRIGVTALRLVIADIQLTSHVQDRSGYVLYQRWHKRYPTLPFLLISGSPSSRDLPAVRRGEVEFLAKPFAIPELLQAVQQEMYVDVGCLRTEAGWRSSQTE